jgi:hypothetical protein
MAGKDEKSPDFDDIEIEFQCFLAGKLPDREVSSCTKAAGQIVGSLREFHQQRVLDVSLKQTRTELKTFGKELGDVFKKLELISFRTKSLLVTEYDQIVHAVGAEGLFDNPIGPAMFSPDQTVRGGAIVQLTEEELDELDEKSDQAISISSMRNAISQLSQATQRAIDELDKKANKESDDAAYLFDLCVAEVLLDQLGVPPAVTRDTEPLINQSRGGAQFSSLMRDIMRIVGRPFPKDSHPRLKRITEHGKNPRGDYLG